LNFSFFYPVDNDILFVSNGVIWDFGAILMRAIILVFLVPLSSLFAGGCSAPEPKDPWDLEGLESVVVIVKSSDYELQNSHDILEDIVVDRLSKHTNLQIYERTYLERILEELGFNEEDIVDGAKKAAELGKLHGSKTLFIVKAGNFDIALVVGMTVTFELIDIETGQTLEQHVETPWKLWFFITGPKAQIPYLIEDAADELIRRRLYNAKQQTEQ